MKKQIIQSFVRQHDQSDCGVACLLSIIKFYDGESTFENLRALSGTSKQGTTFLGLLQAARQIGFEADGLEAENIENLKELNGPAVLHIHVDERFQHYVVFYGFEGEKVIIGDPGKGVILLTKEELASLWQSRALLKLELTVEFEKIEKNSLKKGKWIIALIKQDLNLLLVSVFLGVVMALLSLSTAIFSQKLIDDILPMHETRELVVSLCLLAVLLLTRAGIGFLRGFLLVTQARDFNNRITASFFSSLLHLPKTFFDTRKTGDMIARMNDTRRIQTVISTLSGSIVIDLLVLLISLGFLATYSWVIALFMLLAIPAYFVLICLYNNLIGRKQREVMTGYANAESNYVDTMQGVAAIKSANNELFFERVNRLIYGFFQDSVFALGKLSLRFGWWSEIMSVLFTLGSFSLASWLVLENRLQLGELVAVLSMAGGIVSSLTRLVITTIQVQEAKIAFDRMYEFISIRPEYENVKPEEFVESIEHLHVSMLSFRFPGRKQILRNISLEVRKGEVIALLGESGGGKSTIIQLLQKFYIPEEGEILVNGKSLRNLDTLSFRRHIGVVPQELKIFNGSIIYNIVLSDSSEDIQKAMQYCQSSGIGSYFESLPQGYLTLVGEEGINLSGGQKQLVALARALWRKPSLLLLDEATAALDRKTECFVLQIIEKNKKDTAIILVTHKFSNTLNANRVYVLEDGNITMQGKPEDVAKNKNLLIE